MLVDEISIASGEREYVRSAWIVEGPDTDHPLCVLLDGEHYLEDVDALPILSTLMQSQGIPSMTLLFLSHGGAAARHADYVGNAAFTRFVAEDVVSQARARVPSPSADRHVICGLSLSGLAAAHTSLLYPSLFPAALCQSGSFWWEPDAFARLAQEHPPVGTRFWLSVGDEETDAGVSHPPTGLFQGISQIDGVDRACAALAEHGGDVHRHLYRGGHAFEHWRAELGDALPWLLRTE